MSPSEFTEICRWVFVVILPLCLPCGVPLYFMPKEADRENARRRRISNSIEQDNDRRRANREYREDRIRQRAAERARMAAERARMAAERERRLRTAATATVHENETRRMKRGIPRRSSSVF
ncbi:hypothetical protein L6452_41850 [Arctium lappa]|uniref:Uncharacterized protein n=1 Tax=Arctium lappa TaxID=4217 RepID=A0ACB8XHE6_ARCLA|nr:hypothetical protein L6452_41850 [Arctium lappa]